MPQTINKVLKAIKTYAAKHNQTYIEVVHKINIDHELKTVHKYEAYINSFGIYAQGNNIEELIARFDAVIANGGPVKPQPVENDDLIF